MKQSWGGLASIIDSQVLNTQPLTPVHTMGYSVPLAVHVR